MKSASVLFTFPGLGSLAGVWSLVRDRGGATTTIPR